MDRRESVHGVIFSKDKKKILLIKRCDVPVWVLPGGGIEEKESPAEAAIREVKEETGYEVSLVKKIAEYSPISRLARFTHLYECAIQSGEPTLSAETASIAFFPLKDLPYRLPPPYPDWIQDAALFSNTLIKKKITSVSYPSLFRHALSHPLLVTRFLFSRCRSR